MSERKKWRSGWMVAAALLVPALYVLSSGPTRTLAFRRHMTTVGTSTDGSGRIGVDVSLFDDHGVWWPKVYAPLVMLSEHPWGDLLNSYWDLFPIRNQIH